MKAPRRKTPRSTGPRRRPIEEAEQRHAEAYAEFRTTPQYRKNSARLAALGLEWAKAKSRPPSQANEQHLDELREKMGELRLSMGFAAPATATAQDIAFRAGDTAQRISAANQKLRRALDEAITEYELLSVAPNLSEYYYLPLKRDELKALRVSLDDILRVYGTIGIEQVQEKRRGRPRTKKGLQDAVRELLTFTGGAASVKEIAAKLGVSYKEAEAAYTRVKSKP